MSLVDPTGFGHRFSPAGSTVDPASLAFAQSGILIPAYHPTKYFVVDPTGFEPVTSAMQMRRSTS